MPVCLNLYRDAVRRQFVCSLAVALFLLVVVMPTHAQSTLDLERIQRATVYVMQTQMIGGESFVTCVGSGTIIDRAGLIATNAHLTVPNTDCPGDSIVIAVSVDNQDAPTPTYRAEVAQANVGLDLAVLRVTQELNGRVIEPGVLSLPFVEIGDSSQVGLDETITIVGYPSISGEPVTTTRGTITSFISEPSGGDRSWIKTDATIPGTMTGGGVYNQRGQLIGVPTTVPIVTLGTDTTCTPLEDTNGDGLVNRNDSCVPVGGFINALRPSNFVQPLLRSASLGLSVEKLSGTAFAFNAGGEPTFEQLIISPSVNQGMPTTVARSLPTGTDTLYLFFDYRNMSPETIYELRVSIGGIPNPTYSLAPVRWSGGANGLWYIGIGSPQQVLPNGEYEFTLSINGLVSATNTIIIGAQPVDNRSFGNIFFCIEGNDNTCFGEVYVLPTGNIVSAQFIHRNMTPETIWTRRWIYNGVEVEGSRVEEAWGNFTLQTRSIRLEAPGGLPAGRYRLELYIEGRLSALSEFTIAGASEGAFSRVFSNSRFINNLDNVNSEVSISSFPNDTSEIYALFDWEQLASGTLWRMRWLVDNAIFYDEVLPWAGVETGQNFLTRLSGRNGIPDGSYRMELYVNDVRVDSASIEAEVGIGQLEIDPFDQTVGVQLNGRIIDAETGEGIPGVSFILITEDYSVADFVYDQEQVYAIAVTDRNGAFQLDRLLEFDAPYSLVIEADGYLAIRQDGILVDAETENPMSVQIPLTRD